MTTSAPNPHAEEARDPRSRSLVVGHDGHPASAAALRVAIDLARDLGAHIHVVHIVTLDDYGIDPDTDDFERTRDRSVARERTAIDAALASQSAPWTYHEERGDPARRLAEFASQLGASYIIVGSTSRGLLRTLLAGSVPNQLAHHQQIPVIVVPPHTETNKASDQRSH